MNALADQADIEVAEIVEGPGPGPSGWARIGIVTLRPGHLGQLPGDSIRPERMMQAITARRAASGRLPTWLTLERNMACGRRASVPFFVFRDGPVFSLAEGANSAGRACDDRQPADRVARRHDPRAGAPQRPRIGVVEFASCDGCQLTLSLEDELLAIAEKVDIVEFAEATSRRSAGPSSLFVEGSISTPEEIAQPGGRAACS